MRYVRALAKKEQYDLSYRIYVTRCLQGLTRLPEEHDWYRLIHEKPKPKDTRSGDEIAADIMRRLKE